MTATRFRTARARPLRETRAAAALDHPHFSSSVVQFVIGRPRMLFEESALSWSHADLFRYDVSADGQRFLIVKPESREEAPLQIVVAPRFGEELKVRVAGTASPVRQTPPK